jgi:hypothetical protein
MIRGKKENWTAQTSGFLKAPFKRERKFTCGNLR